MNYKEIFRPGYSPSYLDKNIIALSFFHNLCFIKKGNNEEEGIFLENNTLKPEIMEILKITSIEEFSNMLINE